MMATNRQSWGALFISAILFTASAQIAFAQNLIQNPGLETAGVGGVPANWIKTYWGTPTPTFTYPATGNAGSGATVTFASNSNGDGRWQPTAVNVEAGSTYTYSAWYKSNVASEIDVEYTNGSGALSYGWIADVPSSANAWKQVTAQFTIPSGITKASVFQIIWNTGNLTIDDVSLTKNGSTPPPPPPPATTTPPTLTFSGSPLNITAGQSSALSWSSTDTTSCTASNGWSGSKGLSGTESVSPTATTTYTLSCDGAGGSVSKQVTIGVSATTPTPPPPTPTQPGQFAQGMVSLTFDDSWLTQYTNALPVLQAAGLKGTFYLTSQPIQQAWTGFMTPTQAKDIANKGHEIGGHTVTHADLATLSKTKINTEIKSSKNYLKNITGQTVVSLAYPYGSYTNTVKTLTKNAGYTSGRGVEYNTHNLTSTDKYAMKSQCIETTDSIASIKARIDSAQANKEWYILCFHEVMNNGDQWSTTPARLQEIVDYIKSTGIKVVTVKEGRALMSN